MSTEPAMTPSEARANRIVTDWIAQHRFYLKDGHAQGIHPVPRAVLVRLLQAVIDEIPSGLEPTIKPDNPDELQPMSAPKKKASTKAGRKGSGKAKLKNAPTEPESPSPQDG